MVKRVRIKKFQGNQQLLALLPQLELRNSTRDLLTSLFLDVSEACLHIPRSPLIPRMLQVHSLPRLCLTQQG